MTPYPLALILGLVAIAVAFFAQAVLVDARKPTARRPRKVVMRRATLAAIDRFCAAEGFETPRLDEHRDGRQVWFTGRSPDGREFRFGYEEPKQ